MNMIGHQYKRMYLTACISGDLVKIGQVPMIVTIVEKYSLSIVASLDDMLWEARQIIARLSGHSIAPV